MTQTNLQPPSKVPKISKDYNHLHNHLLTCPATQEETNVGVALFNKTKPDKETLHYENTSRNNINREWPSLILNFNNRKSFRLCQLFLKMKIEKTSVDL